MVVFCSVGDPAQQLQNHVPGFRVEIAGRLICQQYPRRMHQRARDGHALHLSSRKLMRHAIFVASELHPLQPLPRRRTRVAAARQKQRELNVLDHAQRGQQLKRLKDESNFLAAQARETGVIQRRSG